MLNITSEGICVDGRIIVRRYLNLEHGRLDKVVALVLHQTDSSTAQQTFNSYISSQHGAHFLVDKNGQIYQTASLLMRCYHVGKHIRSKCLEIDKPSCDSAAMAKMLAMSFSNHVKAIDAHERAKSYPLRYPVNGDSIGIEIVGKSIDDKTYEKITSEQNTSVQWLTGELYSHFSISSSDVYRHPEVSYKNRGEAASAVWK